MAILGPIVEPPPRLLPVGIPKLAHGGLVGTEAISHDLFRWAIPLHRLAQKPQYCLAVSTFRNESFEHFALMIDGTPKIVKLAVYAHERGVRQKRIGLEIPGSSLIQAAS